MSKDVHRLRRVELAMKRLVRLHLTARHWRQVKESFLGREGRKETLEYDSSNAYRDMLVAVVATAVRYKNIRY